MTSATFGNLQSLSRDYLSAGGQVVRSDAYFNLSGVTYSTAAYIGTQNTNYYTTATAYDSGGRANQVTRPTGTIEMTTYDGLDRVSSTSVGTSTTNQTTVTQNYYDAGGVGDGNLTEVLVRGPQEAVGDLRQQAPVRRDRSCLSGGGELQRSALDQRVAGQ